MQQFMEITVGNSRILCC